MQDICLAVAYTNDDSIHRYIKMIMVLPFLPHLEIPSCFQWLKVQATTHALQERVQYLDTRWINSSTFPPRSWSVYGQPIRTKDDIEGWHHSLNRCTGSREHLAFYLQIHLLHQKSAICSMQVRLVNSRKWQRTQRLAYKNVQSRIFGYWEDYATNRITADRLLKSC